MQPGTIESLTIFIETLPNPRGKYELTPGDEETGWDEGRDADLAAVIRRTSRSTKAPQSP